MILPSIQFCLLHRHRMLYIVAWPFSFFVEYRFGSYSHDATINIVSQKVQGDICLDGEREVLCNARELCCMMASHTSWSCLMSRPCRKWHELSASPPASSILLLLLHIVEKEIIQNSLLMAPSCLSISSRYCHFYGCRLIEQLLAAF